MRMVETGQQSSLREESSSHGRVSREGPRQLLHCDTTAEDPVPGGKHHSPGAATQLFAYVITRESLGELVSFESHQA
jgi:hypothetical protein